MTETDLKQVIYIRALKVAKQHMAPNTRLEVDGYIRSGLPIPVELAGVVLRALDEHERNKNVR